MPSLMSQDLGTGIDVVKTDLKNAFWRILRDFGFYNRKDGKKRQLSNGNLQTETVTQDNDFHSCSSNGNSKDITEYSRYCDKTNEQHRSFLVVNKNKQFSEQLTKFDGKTIRETWSKTVSPCHKHNESHKSQLLEKQQKKVLLYVFEVEYLFVKRANSRKYLT